MKTTKKGFTLIELIVVIAIIGVLAAILVPSMLGYVKKSKIQSANSAASTVMKAANSALAEMDEAGVTLTATDVYVVNTGSDYGYDKATIISFMKPYFENVEKTNFALAISNGSCVACAVKSGAYYGTSPVVYTNKTYSDFNPTEVGSPTSGALKDAVTAYNKTAATAYSTSASALGAGTGSTPAATQAATG